MSNQYWERECEEYDNEIARNKITEDYAERFSPRAAELHSKADRLIAELEATLERTRKILEEK